MTDASMATDLFAPPRVGACAVVLRGPLVLMLRREGKHGAGTWCFPGGWQEFGEPIARTAVRETFEETGVASEAGPVVAVTDDYMADDAIHFTTWFVACRYLDGVGEVVEPDKCPEVRWVHTEMLPTLPLFGPLANFLATYPGWRDRVPW